MQAFVQHAVNPGQLYARTPIHTQQAGSKQGGSKQGGSNQALLRHGLHCGLLVPGGDHTVRRVLQKEGSGKPNAVPHFFIQAGTP